MNQCLIFHGVLRLHRGFRENKNKFFIAYLHILVEYGVFDVIELHFGLKGHTHDGKRDFGSSSVECQRRCRSSSSSCMLVVFVFSFTLSFRESGPVHRPFADTWCAPSPPLPHLSCSSWYPSQSPRVWIGLLLLGLSLAEIDQVFSRYGPCPAFLLYTYVTTPPPSVLEGYVLENL